MIKAQSLSFSYGEHLILKNFDIEINQGERVLVAGANGAGKSTLIQILGGALKPKSGVIQKQLVSVVPQKRSFTLAYTVQEVLDFLPKKKRISNPSEIVDRLGLKDLKEKKITELSQGQQQRVSIALGLLQAADTYLLDEPFSAQDSDASNKIAALIRELSKSFGFLIVSHQVHSDASLYTRVVQLN